MDSVSLFAMHGMTQPKLLFILLLRRRRRLRDGRGAGGSCQPQPQPSHKANSLVVYIHFAPFFFFFSFGCCCCKNLRKSFWRLPNFLNCFVGGIVATKRGFPTMRSTGFSSAMHANDAPRRASRRDPTHLYHNICLSPLTGLYKLFGNPLS